MSAWWLCSDRRANSVLLVERRVVEVLLTVLAVHRHLVRLLPRLCVHALPSFKIVLHLKTTILTCCHQQLIDIHSWGHHGAERIVNLFLLAWAAVYRISIVVHVRLLWRPLVLVITC